MTGASSHPGKFGFVSLHNLLASGYAGGVYGTNLKGEEVLGIRTVADIDDLPDGKVDLVFVCTPAAANPDLLRACARKGIRAAFLTSAGYGEAGDEGRVAEQELVALADELGILLAGPNGQGVVSTPVSLCAQIVAPYPPAGSIGVASQSGNFVSTFLNLSRMTGVGISRAVSAGNAAAVTVADYLELVRHRRRDHRRPRLRRRDHGRARSDGSPRRRRRREAARAREGRSDRGWRQCRGEPHRRARGERQDLRRGVSSGRDHPRGRRDRSVRDRRHVRHATRARGPNTVVLTTAGGWGVVTADAITRDPDIVLMALPDDLRAAIDEQAAAPLESQQSRRLRRWRDPRHHSRSARADRVASRGRRRDLPRARYPVEPGPDDARGPVLPRLRARADRGVPRAAGCPLRRGRRRVDHPDRQADPRRHRTRRSPIRTTPDRPRCVHSAGSATRAASERRARSVTWCVTQRSGGRDRRERANGRACATTTPRRARSVHRAGAAPRRAGDRAVRDAPLGRRADQDDRTSARADPAAAAPAPALTAPMFTMRRTVDRRVAGAGDRRLPRRRSRRSCPRSATGRVWRSRSTVSRWVRATPTCR